MTARYANAAYVELLEASLYYDTQQRGLGTRFADRIEAGIATILEAPSRWPEIDPGFRRYRIDPFPYALVYRVIAADEIEIVAVADLRRLPDHWRNRHYDP